MHGDLELSFTTALIAMVDLQPEPLVLKFGHKGRRWWTEPTPTGTQTLGITGRLELAEPPPPFDIPQQLFEHVYGGGE